MILDPDELSTGALRALKENVQKRPTGAYVLSQNKDDLKELVDGGLASDIDDVSDFYECRLTGNGLEMLKII
jgi:hypothetical protein